jgi:hypothetical protein
MLGAIEVEDKACHDRHRVASVVGNKNNNELPELAIVA